jgi:predicted membrane protein
MDNKSTIHPTPQLAIGLIVILLGVLFTLDNLNLLDTSLYIRYWPALLLAYGVYRLIEPGNPPHFVPGVVFTLLGGILFLNALHFHLTIGQYWPMLLVFIGFMIISHAYRRDQAVSADTSSVVSAFAFLSGVERTCRTQNFRGGELTSIMGGCEIDLRQAGMQAEEAVINTFCMMGSIEIRVPDNWAVSLEILPLLGGCEDHTETHGDGSRKHLIIKGLAVMGGIEVRN